MLDSLHFTLTDGVEFLGLMTGVLGVMKYFDGRREKAQAKADKEGKERKQEILDGQKVITDNVSLKHSDFEAKLATQTRNIDAIETEIRQFMPKVDLSVAFDHEKKNRIEADNAAAILIQSLRNDVTQQGKDIAKLEQNDVNHSENVKRLESRFDKTDAKIDDVNVCLREIASKLKS